MMHMPIPKCVILAVIFFSVFYGVANVANQPETLRIGLSAESVPVTTKPLSGTVYQVTLVTGDIVTWTHLSEGQKSISIIPADPTKLGQSFQTFETPKGTYVIPSDVNLEKLDIELFNIDYLVGEGYQNMTNLPVIVRTVGASSQIRQSIERSIRSFKGAVRDSFPRLSAFAVQLSQDTIRDSVQTLLKQADIEKIWLDRRVHVSLSESVPLIGAPKLWDAGYDGNGIKIAILDTGIDDTHPDLDDLDDDQSTVDPKVIKKIDFTDDLTTEDLFGHGTHCAGIAAGTGAASGGTNKGVAPGAWLWNVKVLNREGTGQWSWLISGIEYAGYGPDGIANTGDEADIISMSLGGNPTDGTDPVSLAVNAAADAGVVVVAAAGNDKDYFRISCPGVASKVITVGASDKYDNLAYFSSKGPTIDFRVKPDVLAPGVNISSSVPYKNFGTYYQAWDGTSMATPHVAGTAALILQKGVPSGWSAPRYVKDALISTAVDLGYDVYSQGGGRISAPLAAYTQVLVDPATVSFGFYSENVLDNATLTFYNLNETSNRVVTFSVGVHDIYTGAPVDCASLNTTSLTIAASSSASILLTINTAVPRSICSGKVIANIDTGQTVSVIFGFSRLNKVTVTKVDRTGAPAVDDFVGIIGNPGFPDWSYGLSDEHGIATFYVTDGTYHTISAGQDYDVDSTIFTIVENTSITTNTLIHLDERNTVSIDFNTNKLGQKIAEKAANLIYEKMLGPTRMVGLVGLWWYPKSALAYVSPTSFNTAFTYGYYPEAYYNASDPWTINSPEWHKLLFSLEDVASSTTFVADYDILVQRTTDYKVAMMPDVAEREQHVHDPIAMSSATYIWRMSVPQRRVEWLSPNPAWYWEKYSKWQPQTYLPTWVFSTFSRSYPPATETYLAVGEHPFTSGAYVYLVAGYLEISGSISMDNFGNRFADYTRNVSGNLTLVQDSTTVLKKEIWDHFYESLSFEGTPEFTAIIEGSCGLNLSTSTRTELRFEANAMQDYRPPQVTMRPIGSCLFGTISPSEVLVNVTVLDESPVPSVGLEYSLNGGATWDKAMKVATFDDTHQFSLGVLSSDTYVSLRANATDSVGNVISQTTIRGFCAHAPTTIDDYDGEWHTQDFTVHLTANDNLFGVAETYYKINDEPTKTVSADGQPLITTESADNKLEYWSVDKAGNKESHHILTAIKLDKTAPTGSITINNNATYTTSTLVTLTLTATDDTSGVHQVRYSNDGIWDTEPWETPSPTKTWTLLLGDGTTPVYYQIKDKAGLISTPYSDTIILDTAPPIGSIAINDKATYTTTTTVTLTLSATDAASGVAEMRFSNDSLTYTEWQTYASSKPWKLPDGDGVKTAYVQFRDHVGLISTYSDTIILDTTPPVGFVTIDGGRTYTNLTLVTLTLFGNCPTSGVSQMRFSNNNVTWSDWEAYATYKTWTLLTEDGIQSVTVQFKDNAGLISSYSDSIILDTTKPAANAGVDQTVNEDTQLMFDGSASQDKNGIATYTWAFTDTTSQTLSGVNPTYTFATPGTYTITLTVTDPAGNCAIDTVIITVLDVTKPVANAGSDRTVNEDTQINLDGSASSDNVGITAYTWTFTDVTTKTLTGPKPTYTFNTPGVYTVTLNVTDTAGNWVTDAVVITVLDITKPAANAGSDQTVNVGAIVTFDAGATSDNVGVVSYEWNFGDETKTGKITTHTYANPGTYIVTLTVKDAAGNSATDSITVTVRSAEEPPPPPPAEAFPMWIVGAAVATIATAATIALLLRKRK